MDLLLLLTPTAEACACCDYHESITFIGESEDGGLAIVTTVSGCTTMDVLSTTAPDGKTTLRDANDPAASLEPDPEFMGPGHWGQGVLKTRPAERDAPVPADAIPLSADSFGTYRGAAWTVWTDQGRWLAQLNTADVADCTAWSPATFATTDFPIQLQNGQLEERPTVTHESSE